MSSVVVSWSSQSAFDEHVTHEPSEQEVGQEAISCEETSTEHELSSVPGLLQVEV